MRKYSVVSDFQEIAERTKSLCCHSVPKTNICGHIISSPIKQDGHSVVVQKTMIQHIGGHALEMLVSVLSLFKGVASFQFSSIIMNK